MFTVDSTIDSIQNAKKAFVHQAIKDSEVASNINELVDAQTAYSKAVVKTTNQTLQKISQELVNAGSEVSNIAKQAVEQFTQNSFVKDLQEKATKEFYESFWREAMKWYQTGTISGKKDTVSA